MPGKKITFTHLFLCLSLLLALAAALTDISLLRFCAALTWLLVIPGALLYKLLNPERETGIVEAYAVFFFYGTCLMLIPALLSYLFQLSWTVFLILWSLEIILVLAAAVRSAQSLRVNTSLESQDIIALSVIIAISGLLLYKGGHFTGDLPHHLSYIRKLSIQPLIDPYNSMFAGIKEIPYNHAYCIIYVILAFINRISSVDLTAINDLSPALLTPLVLSAVYYLGKKIYQQSIPLVVLLFFLTLEILSSHGNNLRFMPNPDQLARNVFLHIVLAEIISLVTLGSKTYRRDIIKLFLFISTLLFTHLYSYLAFYLIVFPFLLLLFFLSRQKNYDEMSRIKPVFQTVLIAGILTVPLAVIRIFMTNYASYARIISSVTAETAGKPALANFYTLQWTCLFLISLSLLFYFLRLRRRSSVSFRLEVLSVFALTGVILTLLLRIPALANLSAKLITRTYSRRFSIYAMYPYISLSLPVLMTWLILKASGSTVVSEVKIRLYTITFTVLCLSLVFYRILPSTEHNRAYVRSEDNVYAYINANLPGGSVICSYGYPAVYIPAFTHCLTLEVESTHRPPVSGRTDRVRANLALLNGQDPDQSTLEAAEEYDCSHVLVEAEAVSEIIFGITNYSLVRENLSNRELFEPVYGDQKYLLFRIRQD